MLNIKKIYLRQKNLKCDSPSADFCFVTDKIMPENPYIHPMWTGSYMYLYRFNFIL